MNKHLKEIIEIIMAFLLVFCLTVLNVFAPLDYLIKDFLYQMPRGVDNNIKIIAIDEKTIDELGPINTWSRQYYADLITQLHTDESNPAVIGFDIIFSGYFEGDGANGGDDAFVNACQKAGNVVVASQLMYSERPQFVTGKQIMYPVEALYLPYQELADCTKVGYANVSQDSDGVVRRVQFEETYQGETQFLFSKKIFDVYCDRMEVHYQTVKTDQYGKALINYSGRPGAYEAISFVDVLKGKIDSKAFDDSIVLVGAYANGMQDDFQVPNGKSNRMYGVEVHANVIQALMQNRFAVNANPFIVGVLFGLCAAILHFIFKRSKVWVASVMLVVAIGAILAIGVFANQNGTCIALLYLPLGAIISYVYCLAIRYITEKRKRQKVLTAFKKYVAPEIVEEIARKGDFNVKLGGENRDIAVLFVDIRGFTTMSEVLTPEKVVEILNQYLNLTTNAIFRNKGTLDKFVGDATMAVFNSPFDLDDYVFRAVCAAWDIVEDGKALEKELLEKYGRTIGFGVGVNCGPAVVGNIGCDFRMDFTAIGDTVNTAARLEANAKKGQVLISQEVYNHVKDRVEVETLGEIPLKGKSKGVCVYSVQSLKKN